ncbi:MAG: sensor domain-containing diguanylate cyclase [Chloroflexi bacterium]|nr:MAG: sensor domain-containing diguanylate cyclase [Chloroflexota bacterium]MBL1194042.1 sensor domain-containing diguanylate cyclase [Chloroflexota bacterium]NOH11336.1 GGDEF domain-containing protein [Chloroflexota bacterium]
MAIKPGVQRSHERQEDMLQTLNTFVAKVVGKLRAPSNSTRSNSDLQKALEVSEERFRLLADHIDEVFWLISADGSEVQFVSSAYKKLTGRSSEMLFADANDWEHSMDPQHRPRFQEMMAAVQGGKEPVENEQEFGIMREDGSVRWARIQIQPMRDEKGELMMFLGVAVDVTENKRLEQELKKSLARIEAEAMIDELTGLLNRRAVIQNATAELSRAMREKRPVSLMVIDIDNLKAVNDEYGHLVGDKILKMASAIIEHSTRPYDWVGRWGGDEFMVILPGADLRVAKNVAARMQRMTRDSVLELDDQNELEIRFSLGLTVFFGTTFTAEQSEEEILERLFGEADQALYEAKQAGRDQVRIYGED